MIQHTWHPREVFSSGVYLAGIGLLLFTFGILLSTLGCGGGGGGISGLPSSQIAQNGVITGRVVASNLAIASRIASTTLAILPGTQAISGADVWIEQLPISAPAPMQMGNSS